jgi:hypothetical protein
MSRIDVYKNAFGAWRFNLFAQNPRRQDYAIECLKEEQAVALRDDLDAALASIESPSALDLPKDDLELLTHFAEDRDVGLPETQLAVRRVLRMLGYDCASIDPCDQAPNCNCGTCPDAGPFPCIRRD